MSEAVVDLSHAFAPEMARRNAGGILTISSGIAMVPMARYATYGATRAFCLAFGDALHTELRRHHGVAVTTACPGGVRSEFFAANGMQPVERMMPRFLWRTPEQVAGEAVAALARNRRLVVPGRAMRAMMIGNRLMPRSLMLAALDRFARAPGE